jgi:bifunctional oligoribonuclease and PAP phosphatase NrnA
MNYTAVKQLLSTPKRVVITSHKNPDGDAIGSSLAVWHYLKALGHTATVVFPTDFPPFLAWLPGAADILIPVSNATDQERGKKAVAEAEVIFCLDFNDLTRIDHIGTWITQSTATKILIDHHIDPKPFADEMLSEVSASSTCELIYDFMVGMGDIALLNETIINCLFTGILTDTGSFSYATSPKLFRTVAALQEYDIDYNALQNQIFNNDSEKRLRLLGYCLSSSMFLLPAQKAAVVILTQQDYKDFDIQRGDTEGIVNFMLRMANVEFATLITDQKHIIKFSFRSKGNCDVQKFANTYFKGGGHKNASGGESHQSLSATWVKFRRALQEYSDAVNS